MTQENKIIQSKNDDITLKDLLEYVLKIKLKYLVPFIIVIISIAYYTKDVTEIKEIQSNNVVCKIPKKQKYKIYSGGVSEDHLKHVISVLKSLGYERTDKNDWDLLWAHEYPFRKLPELRKMKRSQKVNHLPGCGYITSKVDLATSGSKYIPPAFKLPEQKLDLLNYAEKHPEKVFVQKDNNHRHIHIRKLNEIDIDKPGTFVQEYIDKPFLVDGYKFDIGVYTIVTSVDPLRIYIFNGDVLFRYCMHEYYPFNSSDIDKYVIGDDYRPTWEVPSLQHLYQNLNFSMRDSFDAYVRSIGMDPEPMWKNVNEAIVNIIMKKEDLLLSIIKNFPSKKNFFEMMRFDFVLDENLNVYLLEANMSPNLSSAHYPPNQQLYEQVIYNLFALIGLAVRPEEKAPFWNKTIAVFPEKCNNALCFENCSPIDCQLCGPCLLDDTRDNLERAYEEHLSRRDNIRIFPPPINREEVNELLDKDFEELSAENKLMYRWFMGKCLMDESWCK